MVDGAQPAAREPALPLRPHHAARLSAVAEQPVPDAPPQPAVAGRAGGRRGTALPPHPGAHLGGRARGAALRGRRSARGAGGLHREPQRADRDLLRSPLPSLLRSSAAGGLASGPRAERALPRARPRRGRDGARDRRLPRVLCRLPRSGAVAPPPGRAGPERARARCLGRDLQARPLRRPGLGVLSRSRARARGVRSRSRRPRALSTRRPVDADRRRSRIDPAQRKCRGAPLPTRRGPDPGAPHPATPAAATPRPSRALLVRRRARLDPPDRRHRAAEPSALLRRPGLDGAPRSDRATPRPPGRSATLAARTGRRVRLRRPSPLLPPGARTADHAVERPAARHASASA